MSRLVETSATLTVNGDEVDVPVRAWVEVHAIGATLSCAEVFVDGAWTEMDRADERRIEDSLVEQAINEERDAYDDRDPGDFL